MSEPIQHAPQADPAGLEEAPTVYVVDDDPAVAGLIERVLAEHGLHTEVYADADSFLDSYRERAVECLLLDLRLPDASGHDLQRRLAERAEDLPVVMITGYGTASNAVEAMKLGAVDFLEKPFQADALVRSVEGALERARSIRHERVAASETRRKLGRLTPREREVLDLVVDGLSSKEIAEQLGLSKKTVDLHRSHVMGKLEARSIVDLMTMVLTGRPSRRGQGDDAEALEGVEWSPSAGPEATGR